MRLVIGATVVLVLVVAAILLWPVDRRSTLPDTGPGTRRITGAASLDAPTDGSGEAPSRR